MFNLPAFAERLSIAELTEVYNQFSETKIKKFKDKSTAKARVIKLLEDQGVKSVEAINTSKFSAATQEKLATVPKGSQFKMVGRKSAFEGKRIYKKVPNNPRKVGTHGWKSFNLIQDGMTYDAFLLAGGRNNDLRWDLEKGHIRVK